MIYNIIMLALLQALFQMYQIARSYEYTIVLYCAVRACNA